MLISFYVYVCDWHTARVCAHVKASDDSDHYIIYYLCCLNVSVLSHRGCSGNSGQGINTGYWPKTRIFGGSLAAACDAPGPFRVTGLGGGARFLGRGGRGRCLGRRVCQVDGVVACKGWWVSTFNPMHHVGRHAARCMMRDAPPSHWPVASRTAWVAFWYLTEREIPENAERFTTMN